MSASLIERLRARFGADGAETARARLAEAMDLAGHWRQRYRDLVAQTRTRRALERERRNALQARITRRARRVPSVEALRHALQIRLPLARRRAAMPAARARHERLAASSSEYQRAIAIPVSDVARSVPIDGLTWWVPAPSRLSAVAVSKRLRKQSIPYRSIAQSRDLAIGGVMLDIGANIGLTSVPRIVLGDFDVIYCAEPDDLNYRCLLETVAVNGLNGLVVADRVAVSDRVGAVSLCRGHAMGSHRVTHEPAADPAVAVPGLTLDAWVERHGIDVEELTFIKLDTQGSEVHALTGAPRLLAQPHITWQVEVAPWLLRLAGASPEALYALLQDRFTHFMDLSAEVEGPRVRPIGDLAGALAYLEREEEAHTDLIVYRAPR
jgi:FkbM family methyltransferase